jgi:hypothetical protein
MSDFDDFLRIGKEKYKTDENDTIFKFAEKCAKNSSTFLTHLAEIYLDERISIDIRESIIINEITGICFTLFRNTDKTMQILKECEKLVKMIDNDLIQEM